MKKFIALVMTLSLILMLGVPSFAADEALPFENSAFFSVGSYTVHYRTYDIENPAGKIMLLHGFGLSSASMEGLAVEYNGRGYSVVTVDLPNFGYSSREKAGDELLDREDIVFDLMSELGGPWILGGHSMGGGIAANVAIDHPDAVKARRRSAPQTAAQASGAANILTGKIMGAMFNAIIGVGVRIPGVIRLLVAYSFSDMAYAKTYDCSRISDPLKIKGTGAGIAVMSSHTRGTDVSAFRALKMPICIITCSGDKVANKANLSALTESGAENLSVFNVEKGGHMMFEYDPAKTAELTMGTILAA